MNTRYKIIIRSLYALLLTLIAACLAPLKRIHRAFTLWRLKPARSVLLDAHGHGRLSSNLLHHLDAEILRRGGFSYAVLFLIGCALLFGRAAHAQPTSLNPYQPNYITIPSNIVITNIWTNGAAGLTLSNTTSFTLTNGQFANLNSGAYDTIRQYNGESILASVTWTNPLVTAAGLGLTTWWDVTADGTNWTTTHPFVWTIPDPGGSNTVVAWTNLNFLAIDNVRQIRLWGASNIMVGVANVPNTNSALVNWFQFSRSQEIKY